MAENPHFSISAHVVRQLGEELVSDDVTALLELVKNAYDADATYVDVQVGSRAYYQEAPLYFSSENGLEPRPGYIVLEDDGIGMGLYEIQEGWLRISSSLKRYMREKGIVTPKKQRTPLGEKGLGRLSSQRLGSRLEILTRKEKGIGRWWASVSDVQLPSEQISSEENVVHHLAFDWEEFTEDTDLANVPVYLEPKPLVRPKRGTKLIITGLHNPDAWTKDNESEISTRLAQVISPFAEVRPFNVYLTIDGVRKDLGSIAERLRDVAISRFAFSFNSTASAELQIEGKVKMARLGIDESDPAFAELLGNDKGRGFYEYLRSNENRYRPESVRYLDDENWYIGFSTSITLKSIGSLRYTDNGRFADPGPFSGELDEFFLRGFNTSDIEDVFNSTANYREAVRNQVGVRIYRDGFAVRPYGFGSNDWLKIASGTTSGRSFYGLRPDNVIGYVALTATENHELKEKTDREGLIESPYSANFLRIAEESTKQISLFLTFLRRSFNSYKKELIDRNPNLITRDFVMEAKEISGKLRPIEQRVITIITDLGAASQSVNEVVDRTETMPLLTSHEEREVAPILKQANLALNNASGFLQEIQNLLTRLKYLEPAATSLEARIEVLETQISDFSELAGLGLTAEALSHEIGRIAQDLADRTQILHRNLRKKKSLDAETIAYIEFIQSMVSALQKQLNHLSPSLRYVRERQDIFDLNIYLAEITDFYQNRLDRFGIGLHVIFENKPFIVKINKGKITQVLDNLILNSEYWLKEALQHNDIQEAFITIKLEKPLIQVFDNGFGIDPAIEASLFQPFISTKPRNIGRGLGLFITRELLDSAGCTIILLPEKNQHGKRYIFQINAASIIND